MENRRVVPEAVVFDILLFLPVVALLRFKSVCKSWCSMIESSTFVTQHLYHNNEKNSVVCASVEGELYMFSGRRHEMMGSKLNFDFECEHGKKDYWMVNCCDGIVCLARNMPKGVWRISLWNPAMKQVRQLPEPPYFRPFGRTQNGFALGFDRKTRDYKIVRIILERCPNSTFKRLRNSVVQVYSMRSDAWRTIHEGDNFPITWMDNYVDIACNNEICVWIGGTFANDRGGSFANDNRVSVTYGGEDGNRSIFYFDLGDEAYGIVPAPDTLLDHDHVHVLAFVSEKLTLVKCYGHCRSPFFDPCNPSPFVYEIWVMDEFGKKESWNKVYRVEESLLPLQYIVRITSLSNNGQFIVRGKKDGSRHEQGLYLHDLVTLEESLLLALDHDRPFLDDYQVINYTESLVSVNSID